MQPKPQKQLWGFETKEMLPPLCLLLCDPPFQSSQLCYSSPVQGSGTVRGYSVSSHPTGHTVSGILNIWEVAIDKDLPGFNLLAVTLALLLNLSEPQCPHWKRRFKIRPANPSTVGVFKRKWGGITEVGSCSSSCIWF